MESWRRVFREGFAPTLPLRALRALRMAIREHEPKLIQGQTTFSESGVPDSTCDGACPIAFAGWIDSGLETIEEVEEQFARNCFAADQQLGEPAECRHFLNWWDETPIETALAELLPEVELAIKSRAK